MPLVRKNIIANYLSQFYVLASGLLCLPIYIELLGAEAYGVIAFFTLLQSWFALLDMGLTPTVSRETVRFKSGELGVVQFLAFLRFLRITFYSLAVFGAGGLFLAKSYFIGDWLAPEHISSEHIDFSLTMISLIVPLRWVSGLYRGIVIGNESLVWLGIFNSILATLKFFGVLAVLLFNEATLTVFFTYQLIISILENFFLWLKAQSITPDKHDAELKIPWSIKPIKEILRFSLSIGFTSSLWVFVSQTDKLLLSGILSLEDYGQFTLAVVLAGGIVTVVSPIGQALLPRLTHYMTVGDTKSFTKLYKSGTQLVAWIGGAMAITLAITSKEVFLLWTGNLIIAENVSLVLSLYSLGNLFVCIAGFSYYLQYAKGKLKYHVIGSISLVVILLPSVYGAAISYGGVGAGFVWLVLNLLFLFLWVGFIHGKLMPGMHISWLLSDVLKILLPSTLAGGSTYFIMSYLPSNSIFQIITIVFVFITSLLASSPFVEQVRLFITKKYSEKRTYVEQ